MRGCSWFDVFPVAVFMQTFRGFGQPTKKEMREFKQFKDEETIASPRDKNQAEHPSYTQSLKQFDDPLK